MMDFFSDTTVCERGERGKDRARTEKERERERESGMNQRKEMKDIVMKMKENVHLCV